MAPASVTPELYLQCRNRCHGPRFDLFRLAAHLHGLPLRLGDGASAPERGAEIAALNHAIELRSWMAAPDAGQSALREAADGRDRLLTMEREWREARLRVDHRAGGRSNSRLPAAVDLLAASPLLSISALAEALGCSVEGASRMLDALVGLEVAAEVTGRTGRGARRLYGLKRLLPIRAETTAVRRRARGGRRGRPKRVLTAPFAELASAGRGRGGAGRGAGRAGAPGAGELRF